MLPRAVHLDPDNVIPSVEDDLNVSGRQETNLRQNGLDYSNRHLQDQFVGPRIVELEDDPASPVVKRRRIDDNVPRPTKVTYYRASDRSMQPPGLGPTIPLRDGDHPVPMSGAMGNLTLNGTRFAHTGSDPVIQSSDVRQRTNNRLESGFVQRRADETAHRYAPSSFPSLRPEHQLHRHSSPPLDLSQNRLLEGLPAWHKPERLGSHTKSILGLHEPSQSWRLQQSISSTHGVKEPLSNETPRVYEAQMKGMYQPLPVRPRSQHPDENNRPSRYDRPASGHIYKARSELEASGAGPQEHVQYPPAYEHSDHYNKIAQAGLPSGRLPQREQVDHRLYWEENRVPKTDHGTIQRDPEVICITSSPMLEER